MWVIFGCVCVDLLTWQTVYTNTLQSGDPPIHECVICTSCLGGNERW